MKKILCFAIVMPVVLILANCRSPKPTAEPPPEKEVPVAVTSETCVKKGTPNNFNDQRIVAFQKLVQLQILRIKALPMTEGSTGELAELERIRRRVSYPLLSSSLAPKAVTIVLTREAKNFIAFLEFRRGSDTQAQSLYEEVKERFLPLVENEEHWNCLERPTDFQEDSMSTEKKE